VHARLGSEVMSALSTAETKAKESPRPAGLTSELISEEATLLALREEWNELLSHSKASSVFLTWEWVEAWWRTYGESRCLFVITVRDCWGKLVGVAPFYRECQKVFGCLPIWLIRFLGIGGDVSPNYLDIISEEGREQEVVGAVIDRLRSSRPAWQVIELAEITEQSPNLLHLEQEFRSSGWRVEKAIRSICPFVSLPTTWDEYLGRQSSNFRKHTKQYLRVIARDFTVAFRQVERGEDLPSKMELLAALHRDRWGRKSRSFASNRYTGFHREVARRFLMNGWLRLYFLIIDGKEVGALYCYKFDDVMSFYQSGRDKHWDRYHVGTVMFAKAIQAAIREDCAEFDFLQGAGSYKLHWTHQRRNTLVLLSGRSTVATRCFFSQRLFTRRCRQMAEIVLRTRAGRWVKSTCESKISAV
jgi:CelD/BcsL family acetyltransferase involved in cellulose biosynthesis